MKKVGIWLDKEKAHIVTLLAESEELETIESGLEFYNPKGGSRSKTRWGPQEVIDERTYMEREKQQLKRYFDRLVQNFSDADSIAIFGPAETYEKFAKELKEAHPELGKKLKGTFNRDSMTQNQIRAMVREFYHSQL